MWVPGCWSEDFAKDFEPAQRNPAIIVDLVGTGMATLYHLPIQISNIRLMRLNE